MRADLCTVLLVGCVAALWTGSGCSTNAWVTLSAVTALVIALLWWVTRSRRRRDLGHDVLGGCVVIVAEPGAAEVEGPKDGAARYGSAVAATRASYSVFTYNTWMLPEWLNKTTASRGLDIARRLAQGHVWREQDPEAGAAVNAAAARSRPSLVCLQECFSIRTQQRLCALLSAHDRYPWVVYPRNRGLAARLFPKAVAGSGLFMLSRLPVVATGFEPFSEALGSETFSRKGVMGLCLRTAPGRVGFCFNMHMQADPDDEMLWRWPFVPRGVDLVREAQRIRDDQFAVVGRFVSRFVAAVDRSIGLTPASADPPPSPSSSSASPPLPSVDFIILCGDTNEPSDYQDADGTLRPTARYLNMLGLLSGDDASCIAGVPVTIEDCYRSRHPSAPGFTYDFRLNRQLPPEGGPSFLARLDYVFAYHWRRPGEPPRGEDSFDRDAVSPSSPRPAVVVEHVEVVMMMDDDERDAKRDDEDGRGIGLSDHFGVALRFSASPDDGSGPRNIETG